MIGRILRGGGAAFVPCRVAAMSPPGQRGSKNQNAGAIEEIKDLHVRRIAERQQQEDAEVKTIQARGFLTMAPLAAPNDMTPSVCLHAGRTWRSKPGTRDDEPREAVTIYVLLAVT